MGFNYVPFSPIILVACGIVAVGGLAFGTIKQYQIQSYRSKTALILPELIEKSNARKTELEIKRNELYYSAGGAITGVIGIVGLEILCSVIGEKRKKDLSSEF